MLVPEAGVHIAERYRLTHKLGEGGMGSVWAAHDEKLRRDVAIKLLTERIADSESAMTRFEREAMAIARLRSPYITQVYDYGIEDGSPYIIMELLHGEDLKQVLLRDRRLSIEQTTSVVNQVAKALHAAHEQGIVHRDLKPANVFIATEHDDQVCKVFDFGVAKALNDIGDDSDTTAEGALLGTPRYMSPEQAHGAKEVDHRTDLWSLGVIAYQCLTGQLPFVAVGTGHVLVKICTEEPVKPSDVHYALSAEVDAFIAKALAKEPEDRFQSAKDLAMAFAGLGDESLSSFGGGTPSWSGMAAGRLSSPPTDEHGFDPSDPSLRGELMGGASFHDASESPGDGTLGPTMAPARPWLGSRGARVGAGLFASVAVGILAFVALTRKDAPSPTTGPPAAAATMASSAAPSAVNAPPGGSATAASARPAAPSATAAASTSPKRSVARRPRPSSPPTAEPTATSAPKTAPKNGDGLDLFDKRF